MQGSGQAGVKMVIAPDVSLRGPGGAMAISGRQCRFVPAAVKMAPAPELSLRGGRRPTWRPEREARGSALGVQSRSSRLHRGKVTGEIATAFPRLPRPLWGLAMTNLSALRRRRYAAIIVSLHGAQ